MMKIIAVIMFVLGVHVYAGSYGQAAKVTLAMRATLREVIEKLEEVSGYHFVLKYNTDILDKNVDVNYSGEKIELILNDLLKDTGLSYQIIDKYIAIKSNGEPVPGSQPQRNITGRVSDSSGQPLPGVTVAIKGTTWGTISDGNGMYNLSAVPDNAILIFSFVGMKTQEIAVSGKATVNVIMQEEAIGLEEVVAIGYGTMKKVNLTGSISSVTSEDLVKSPVQDPLQSLKGKTPGLSITQGNGEPGNEGYTIRIRGLNSYGSSNDPLVIVDGVVGSLDMLNVKDIESISVLKDAASSAIYGARAANGVILVTTKSGKIEPMNLQYSSNFAVHRIIMPFEFMDQHTDAAGYMELLNKAADNAISAGYAAASVKYSTSEIEKYRVGTEPGYQSFDWFDYMIPSPLVMDHHLRVTGGNEKARYDVSLGYYDQDGIIRDALNYKKYTGRTKFDFKINDQIEFGTNVIFEHGIKKGPFTTASDLWWTVLMQQPTFAPQLPDGSGRWTDKAYSFEYSNKNPALTVSGEAGSIHTYTYNVLANAYLRINFLKDFSWDITGSTKLTRQDSKTHEMLVPTYLYHTGVFSRNWWNRTVNSITDTWDKSIHNTVYSTLRYNKIIAGTHSINLLLGYNQESYDYGDLSGYRSNFSSNSLDALSAGSTEGQTNNGTISDWSLQSLFGRVNYDYKGKYLFEASFRYDGSSRFHPDYRWGFFPSLSAGWRLSEESFMKKLQWIDNLKVRGTWGQLGNQEVGIYPYQNTVSLGDNYAFSDTESQGAYIGAFTNDKITWETTTISNLGFDLSIFNGLFSASLDLFNKQTKDIIRSLQVPSALGLTGPTINGGKMKNTGYEIILGHGKQISDFRYQVDLTLSHYKNELVEYGAREISGNFIYEEGLPYGSWYLHEFDGIFQDQNDITNSATHPYKVFPGAIKLRDQNDDKVIDADDKVVMDGVYPKFDGGINLACQYKNFDFSVFLYGVYGYKSFGSRLGSIPFYQAITPVTFWEDAWTEENHSNKVPLLVYNHINIPAMRYSSSFYLYDKSYLRLKNLQIGYNIPRGIISKIGMQSCRVYFSGENLLKWDKNKFGGDPEMNTQTGYPQVRILSLGLDVKF